MVRRQDPRRPADFLREEWEERARSPFRDFFVASHPGWDDPETWESRAAADAELVLSGVEPASRSGIEVLEVGCGVGRLAAKIAPQVKGYTGFDISPSMVEEARRRNRGLGKARFFVSDGLDLPGEAKDRTYDLAFALAVFIHCPREVIRALARNVFRALAPGGEFRFQVFADPSDPDGLESREAARAIHEEIARSEALLPAGAEKWITPRYIGARFGYGELRDFLLGTLGVEPRLERYDLGSIYALIRKD